MQACQQFPYRGTLVVLERLSNIYGCDLMSQETVGFSSTDCHKSNYLCKLTVFRSKSQLTSSNDKAGLVPTSPALQIC